MKSMTRIILIFSGSILFAFTGYANQAHHPQSGDNPTPSQQTMPETQAMPQKHGLIQLSESQKQTLAKKALQHRKKLILLFAEIEVTQLEQAQLEFADPLQESAVKKNIEKFNDLRKQVDLENWASRNDFRQVLTPEQLKKLKKRHAGIGLGMGRGMRGQQQGMMSGMMGQQGGMGQGMMGQQGGMGQGMMGQNPCAPQQSMMQGQNQNQNKMEAPTQ